MKKLFFCLLFVNSFDANSQSLTWYEGSIVLTSEEVIVGMMVVDPSLDLVLVQENEKRTVYPAHKIKTLYYYDPSADINRRYVSLREKNTFHTYHQLFEVVVHGEVCVLRKQKTKFPNPSDGLDYTYYVNYQDELLLLRKFGKKIYPRMKSSLMQLEGYVSSNRLREYDAANSITIIEFYNRQLRGEMMTAKH